MTSLFISKDFANKPKSRSRKGAATVRKTQASVPNNTAISPWIWSVTGLSVGIFLTLLFFIGQQSATIGPSAATNPDPTPGPEAASKPRPKYDAIALEESTDKEKYMFRELLDNKTIDVQVEKLASKGTFIMQCGSFRTLASADALKAQLALIGFEPDIKMSDTKNGIWYRVLLGPYQSKRAAENDRHRLQREQINRCKIW